MCTLKIWLVTFHNTCLPCSRKKPTCSFIVLQYEYECIDSWMHMDVHTHWWTASKVTTPILLLLVHEVKDGCWWYDSKSWTFPSIFRYILSSCCRWQQRGSLNKWHQTWKYGWNKSVSIPPWEKNCNHWHSPMLAKLLWKSSSEWSTFMPKAHLKISWDVFSS